MRTAVAETSLRAYREIEADGTLGAQSKTIMLAIHSAWSPGADFTLQELCVLTGLKINAVSGRVNELKTRHPKYLVECKQRLCTITGRTVTPVSLRYPKAQRELFGSAE